MQPLSRRMSYCKLVSPQPRLDKVNCSTDTASSHLLFLRDPLDHGLGQAFFIIIYYLLIFVYFPSFSFGDAGSDLTCIQLILLPLRPSSATDSDPREPNFCCRLSEAAYIDHLRSLDTQRSCKTSSSQCSIGVGSRSRRSNQLVS